MPIASHLSPDRNRKPKELRISPAYPPDCVVSDGSTFIAALLKEQCQLTAVELFAEQHGGHAGARRYSSLLPAQAPSPGEQYAFEVDLDRCSGCKSCVAACHSLNGLDDNETWREVGLLVSPSKRRRPTPPALVQHVTTSCHHCADPACLNGCPVLAYDKDPITGIVRHLDDQCIGCQYCVLKCPYDAPKYNERLGIVRKCDMCSSRLATGEAPACAQACPSEAIRIVLVRGAEAVEEARLHNVNFLPGAPGADYTVPTTRYVSERNVQERACVSADEGTLKLQPAHWALVCMLVLSQASVGIATAAALMKWDWENYAFSLGLIIVGTIASVLHLGRPAGAWRFFLGLRRSWLSREILAFGLYLPALGLTAVSGRGQWLTVVVGTAAILCSAMIYHDTRRVLWHAQRSLALFIGTGAVLGLGGSTVLHAPGLPTAALLAFACVTKLAIEVSIVRHIVDPRLTPLKKTALLITQRLHAAAFVRVACLLLGGIGIPLMIAVGATESRAAAIVSFVLLMTGELIERMLFFRTVDAPKMPGQPVENVCLN